MTTSLAGLVGCGWAALEWRDPPELRGCGFLQLRDSRMVFQRGYADMAGYIRQSSSRLADVTGQSLGAAFFERILSRPDTLAPSIPPSAAILQVRRAQPGMTLRFAHAVQRAHFEGGEDLNDPTSYAELIARLKLHLTLDLPAAHQYRDEVEAEFRSTRKLGISSFPTVLVRSAGTLRPLPTVCSLSEIVAQVSARLNRSDFSQLAP